MIGFIARLILGIVVLIGIFGNWAAYPIVILFWIGLILFLIRLGADVYYFFKGDN
jgi:hypothetical protein